MNIFNIKLKEYRILSNLTQEGLATEINKVYNYPISKSTISQLENNRIEPNIELLIYLSDYFNITINQILGLDPDNNSNEFKLRIEELKFEIIVLLMNKFKNID